MDEGGGVVVDLLLWVSGTKAQSGLELSLRRRCVVSVLRADVSPTDGLLANEE
jgi:hypothetical protein